MTANTASYELSRQQPIPPPHPPAPAHLRLGVRNPDEVAESDELDRVAGRADLPVNLPPSADSAETKRKKERST